MVEATTLTVGGASDDVPPQTASDIAGPVRLTGGAGTCRCNTQHQQSFSYKRQSCHNHCICCVTYINWFDLCVLWIKICGSESKAQAENIVCKAYFI